MKNKFIHLISLATATLALSSCGFQNVFKVTLSKLHISDANSKVYVVGESYFDFADLSIKGTYSNGTVEYFERTDVEFTLTCDGATYNVSSPFETAGNYSLKASKDGVKSNALTIRVLAAPEYVTNLVCDESLSVAVNKSVNAQLSILPNNYTVAIEATSSNSDIASLTKVDNHNYTITGVSTGEADILYRALTNETDYISASCHVTVTENYVSSITVSGPNTVAREASIVLNLDVQPNDFSVDVTAVSSNPTYASVEKVDNTKFRVNGHVTGNVVITFTAASSASTTVSATYNVEVLSMSKTNIRETYNNLSKKNLFPVSACPTVGDVKLLVIPVWFSDSNTFVNTNKKDTIRNDIQKAYFGTTSETGWHSVASYYREESSGLLNMTGTVSDWYNTTYSADEASTFATSNDDRQGNLVKAATDWYFGTYNPSDSRKSYDSDGDGYLDSVMLIYGAPDYQKYSYSGDNLWAYCFWVQDTSQKSKSNPGVNVFFWASYDFMFDSSNASSHTGHNYYNGDCSHCNIDAHTYIHEMGHVFGLEDYYDYSNATSPAGGFSMQDHNVGGHDAFSVMALGWADPYIPTSTCDITINDFQSSKDLILLSPSWNSYDSPFDEYLLLELYTPTGLNKFDTDYTYAGGASGPGQAGIRLWHVDARLFASNYSFTKTTTSTSVSVCGALNNTSSSSVRQCNVSRFTGDDSYQSYNLLQLIRNSTTATYSSKSVISSYDLFRAGSSFSMSTYYRQFVDGPNLDIDVISLGWTFSVNSIEGNPNGTYSASVTVTIV